MKKDKIGAIVAVALVTTTIGVGVKLSNEIESQKDTIDNLKSEINIKDINNKNLTNEINEALIKLNDVEKEVTELNEELVRARREIEECNRVTSFNHLNALEKSGATATHMRRALKNTGLYYDAEYFVEAEELYGINAYFIAGIAAFESSWGTSNRAINQNNLTGYAVYSSASRGKDFGGGRRENILETARLLKEDYLTEGGSSFNGYRVEDVNTKYCFDESGTYADYSWCTNIISIAYDLKNKGNNFSQI